MQRKIKFKRINYISKTFLGFQKRNEKFKNPTSNRKNFEQI